MEKKSSDSLFLWITQGREEMSAVEFSFLMRGCGVHDRKKLNFDDVDLIFKKARSKGSRGITYRQFEDAVKLCSEKKGVEFNVLMGQIISYDGPLPGAPRPQKTVDE